MIPANVKLSESELALVSDAGFILTKNRIIEKVYSLFGTVSEAAIGYLHTKQELFPPEIYANSPKIYRGEKYRELPYVMLDYPRHFEKDHVFAIRHFFWWGKHFSVTLHLAGRFAAKYGQIIIRNIYMNGDTDYFICISENQWEHHFEPDNFIPVIHTDLSDTLESIRQKKFLKVAKRMPLEEWERALLFFTENYKGILNLFQSEK